MTQQPGSNSSRNWIKSLLIASDSPPAAPDPYKESQRQQARQLLSPELQKRKVALLKELLRPISPQDQLRRIESTFYGKRCDSKAH